MVQKEMQIPQLLRLGSDIFKDLAAIYIFKVNETGLYYKLLPDRSHISKGQTFAGGKKSKAQVTILVGVKKNGTEKLPLLVIGKSTASAVAKLYCARTIRMQMRG